MYELREPYPAANVIGKIRAHLEGRGWRPLKEDLLNPGIPTSLVRGWTEYRDATTKPAAMVHEWIGQWEDSSGRIAWYVLRYEDLGPKGAKSIGNAKLMLRATLLSGNAAAALRKNPSDRR
jgi:hypothetical protein